MRITNFKFQPVKWHLCLLVFVLLNFVAEIVTGNRLNPTLIFFFKIVLYTSGIILFFKYLKPFRLIAIYFSFYTVSGIVAGLFFLFGGISLALMASILLYPIYPKQTAFRNQTIKVYQSFNGFLSYCCPYEVVTPKLYFFEKRQGSINIEKTINPNKDKFSLKDNKILYTHEIADYNFDTHSMQAGDTTEILSLE